MRRTDIKTYPCHIQNNEAIASFDDSFRESVRKILSFGRIAEFLHCKYQYFEILCAKGFGVFPKLHLPFAVSLNAHKIRPKKNKEFQYFFKFAIDPIFEFCYTFQTYLCKMGGSLSVRLNFFQAE